jgi:tetratricopeptide (TPR) repeat protein
VALAEGAVAARSGELAPILTLAKALGAAGRPAEAAAALKAAAADFPDEEKLGSALAFASARIGEVETALALAASWRDRPWAPRLAFHLLAERGRFDEAAAWEEEVGRLAPADPDLLECRARRARDDPAALFALSEAALAADPGASHALYYRAVALALLGRPEEAAAIMDVGRFLARSRLGDPSLRARVREEIITNPTLRPDPAGHTTRHGLRTLAFPAPGDSAAPALLGLIRGAVGDYAAALSGDHPFVRARPERAALTAWAILLRGRGHQLLHHHPRPWLTGAYYVDAPGGRPRPGAIRIGRLPGWAPIAPPWPVIDIAPEPGTLLLFPSFLPHETLPTESDADRISVAFDVDKADGSAP